eukprot:PITA_02730
MALVCTAPLLSSWGVRKSFICSKNDSLALSQELSSTGRMLKRKKSVTPITPSMNNASSGMLRPKKCVIPISLTASISNSNPQQRHTGNHHSNVWDDDLIHSLSTSYSAPAYRERAETLVEDIKHLFLSAMEVRYSDGDDDLISRLQNVDTMECLGIDRQFQSEIKVALDYIYSCWNERGIEPGSRDSLSKDLNSTALGFRALRMHRYDVSSGHID